MTKRSARLKDNITCVSRSLGLVVLVALLPLPVARGRKAHSGGVWAGGRRTCFRGIGMPRLTWDAQSTRTLLGIDTSFSDGRFTRVAHANVTFTNLDTGTSYFQKSRFQETDVYDEATNTVFSEASGRFYTQFYPGDQGPFGEVGRGERRVLPCFDGSNSITFDADIEVYASFSYTGDGDRPVRHPGG